jgi:hypothetical protein
MYKINVAGTEHATNAATWLKEQSYAWDIKLESIGTPAYVFSFDQESAAAHFALKWT